MERAWERAQWTSLLYSQARFTLETSITDKNWGSDMTENKNSAAGNPVRTAWGRARLGTRTVPAMMPAIPLGILLAALIAAAAALAGFAPQQPLLGAAIVAALLALPMCALAWAFLVDRDSLEGAASRPEESVESRWYDNAAAGAFHDLLIFSGLGTAVLFLTPLEIEGSVGLLAVSVVGMLSAGIRYTVNRRRG